ncbi:MAG: transposase [SAR324 cluster bacterium]|nr:transposase [SAR324 cluster bacterium]
MIFPKPSRINPKNSNDGKMPILPERWMVERTLAWFGGFHRIAKDFEILIETAENMVRIAMTVL